MHTLTKTAMEELISAPALRGTLGSGLRQLKEYVLCQAATPRVQHTTAHAACVLLFGLQRAAIASLSLPARAVWTVNTCASLGPAERVRTGRNCRVYLLGPPADADDAVLAKSGYLEEIDCITRTCTTWLGLGQLGKTAVPPLQARIAAAARIWACTAKHHVNISTEKP